MAVSTDNTLGEAPVMIDLTRPRLGRRAMFGDAIAGVASAMVIAGAGVAMATSETLGGIAGEADNPFADAELRALADQFCRLECMTCHIINTASGDEEDEADRQAAPLVGQQHELADRIEALPATTMDGLKAKARCAVMFGASSYDAELSYMGDRILSSLLTDLVGFPIANGRQAEREMRRRFETGEAA